MTAAESSAICRGCQSSAAQRIAPAGKSAAASRTIGRSMPPNDVQPAARASSANCRRASSIVAQRITSPLTANNSFANRSAITAAVGSSRGQTSATGGRSVGGALESSLRSR